ncbi:MAG TPA: GNAT family N-acetyltransferase [Chthonomonadales bacterium]|nr:GNAT family N-acetyltransferase [Chthonomonadales bacterium]
MSARKRQLFMRRPHLDGLPPLPSPPPGYGLRLHRRGEEEFLAAALRGAFPGSDWSVETVLSRLVDAPDVEAVYVVTFEDVPVGTASARLIPTQYPGTGYLHWVGVAPAHQGKRLGALVSLRVLHHFREDGCVDAVLETDDFRLPAIKTYLDLGFVPEPRDPPDAGRWAAVLQKLGWRGG